MTPPLKVGVFWILVLFKGNPMVARLGSIFQTGSLRLDGLDRTDPRESKSDLESLPCITNRWK